MEAAVKTIIGRNTGGSHPGKAGSGLHDKAGERHTGGKKKPLLCDRVERITRNIFIIVFALFITIQAILTNDGMRGMLVREPLDGEPIGDEVFLYEKCTMELKLVGKPDCPELKVLVNGVEAGAFHDSRVVLELKEGDVVELDASRLLVHAEVQISAVSRNLAHLLGRTVTAANGIVPVAVADTGE